MSHALREAELAIGTYLLWLIVFRHTRVKHSPAPWLHPIGSGPNLIGRDFHRQDFSLSSPPGMPKPEIPAQNAKLLPCDERLFPRRYRAPASTRRGDGRSSGDE